MKPKHIIKLINKLDHKIHTKNLHINDNEFILSLVRLLSKQYTQCVIHAGYILPVIINGSYILPEHLSKDLSIKNTGQASYFDYIDILVEDINSNQFTIISIKDNCPLRGNTRLPYLLNQREILKQYIATRDNSNDEIDITIIVVDHDLETDLHHTLTLK